MRNVSTADHSPRPRMAARRNTISQMSPKRDFTYSEMEHKSATMGPVELN